MDLPVHAAGFQSQKLSVQIRGVWRGQRLLLNGSPVEGKKGNYVARNDSGQDIAVSLKTRFPDPVPAVLVDGLAIELARPLKWHEYLWMGAPVALIFAGGALGGGFGAGALYLNARIFRSDRGTAVKYALTGLVSAATVVIFLVIAVAIQLFLRRP